MAVKCGMQKRILKLCQKIFVTDNATPLRFVIIVSIIPKDSYWMLVFPLTNFLKHAHFRGTQQRFPPKYIDNAF